MASSVHGNKLTAVAIQDGTVPEATLGGSRSPSPEEPPELPRVSELPPELLALPLDDDSEESKSDGSDRKSVV